MAVVVRDHMKAEVTWAGLPYRIWKEGRKISSCTHEREGKDPAGRLRKPSNLGCWPLENPRVGLDAERSRRERIPDRLGI